MRFLDSIFSLFQLLVRSTCWACLIVCQQGSRVHQQRLMTILMLCEALVFISRESSGGNREIMIRSRWNRFMRSWTSVWPHAGASAWIYELSGRRIIGKPGVSWQRSEIYSADQLECLLDRRSHWPGRHHQYSFNRSCFRIHLRICLFTHCTFECVAARRAGLNFYGNYRRKSVCWNIIKELINNLSDRCLTSGRINSILPAYV